jgi:hypothetical protein
MRVSLVHLIFVRNVIDVFFRCKTVLCIALAVDPCAANHGALGAY